MRKKEIKIIVQPRKSQRDYIYDYVATVYDGNNPTLQKGSGVSIDRTIAKNRAIFEAIERYFTNKIEYNSLVELTINQLKNKGEYYLNPNEIIRESSFMGSNKAVNYISDSKKIDWVKGISLTKNRSIWIPVFAVFSNYKNKKGERFFRTTSCGVSIHRTRSRAIIHSVLELIERDAALLAWFTKKRLPSINLVKIKNRQLQKLIRGINSEGKRVKVFLTTTNIKMPSVFALIYKINSIAAFGIASEPDLEKSILKSIEEALMMLNTAELINFNTEIQIKKGDIKNFLDHVLYYSFPANKVAWQFLLKQRLFSLEEIKSRYHFISSYSTKSLVNYLANQGIELIVFDFSNSFFKDSGLFMTRVIARGLCPMFVGNAIPPAIKMIIRKRLKMPSIKLNVNPHPFG